MRVPCSDFLLYTCQLPVEALPLLLAQGGVGWVARALWALSPGARDSWSRNTDFYQEKKESAA